MNLFVNHFIAQESEDDEMSEDIVLPQNNHEDQLNDSVILDVMDFEQLIEYLEDNESVDPKSTSPADENIDFIINEQSVSLSDLFFTHILQAIRAHIPRS